MPQNKRYLLISLAAAVLAGLSALAYFTFVRADVLAANCAAGPIIGEIRIYAGTTPPDCWKFADGVALSRTDYSDLFTVVGTTFGAGDSSTTFNLPDLRGRMPLGNDDMGGPSAGRIVNSAGNALAGNAGAEMVTLTINEMPSHDHSLSYDASRGILSGGGGSVSGSLYGATGSGGAFYRSTHLSGSGQAHNNMPPYLTLHYIIFVGK